LSDQLRDVFDESEIYRMDHYLGKETVQNILTVRFGNVIFEPLWSRQYVNHVQITAAESVGVEGRGSYYQETGALKDMIQNHLLQVMATIAMERGTSIYGPSASNERSKLLQSIKPMKPEEIRENAVPGQYGPAQRDHENLPGFRQELGVNAEARTDTYAAVTLFIENSRWVGVPFYLRTGKRMPKRVTEIAIQFNPAPLASLNSGGISGAFNQLILRIQPEEGISLRFLSKRPGARMTLRPASMDFNSGSSLGERSPSDYENLFLDAIIGDPTFYPRQDMVEAGWNVIEPIQNAWREMKFEFPNYAAGTWGPAEADEMLARRGHVWRKP
jgi:glucose-6-phosphate 1-dehydrogenase